MRYNSYHAGWMFYADLSGVGSESKGNMLVLIISSELNNTLQDSVLVVPCTLQTRHANWEQHVAVFAEDSGGNQTPAIAMTEHTVAIDKSRLGRCVGKVNKVDYDAVIDNLLTYTIRKEI